MSLQAPPAKSPVPQPPPAARRAGLLTPWILLLPGLLWLVVFFLVPILTSVGASVQTGNADQGYRLTWDWGNYGHGLSDYLPQYGHSLLYSVLCTVFCLLLGYPVAYCIAFRGGRFKSLLMALVVVPSFTSFLIRTIAWKTILSDNGPIVSVLNDLHVLNATTAMGWTVGNHVLASPAAVVFGMVYNFLPFMILPLYTSLEKIDPRLHEAGSDLYCDTFATWRRVTLPLSMPGVVGGTLLTFIPAVGDYINAQLLGNPNTGVVGQKIEDLFLRQTDGYPVGSAISVVLMAGTLILVLLYIRKAGTEDLI
ncbi:ABC transporter permease [Streptomyces sp. SL13]|uniref:ABC transporter permease n=1 Tax=Streptantibioticus silvisoli TaxID=2705255 RepID=A0AA90HDI9_9ACTN|nr:ABC transporter permease [Streptantibioticus silvisoli]MDI5965295.1 ABC transporter permease [Streptantibioticus silvisoli]MDI5972922.1 ABC transporter permease [Streptantibioticus silvisoli]